MALFDLSRGACPPGQVGGLILPLFSICAAFVLIHGNGLGGNGVLKGRIVMMIHDLKRQGLSVLAIARRTGHDPKTVRKYLSAGLEVPVS